jgi:hypothetical protein
MKGKICRGLGSAREPRLTAHARPTAPRGSGRLNPSGPWKSGACHEGQRLVCVGKGGTVVYRSCLRHLDRWLHPQGKAGQSLSVRSDRERTSSNGIEPKKRQARRNV